ncbi:MAG: ABC transporter ATP-binding protein [Clostridiales bacterium]|nr:ABC transporter ATP-binding protein [Clostridiales bacterium]
MKIEERMVTGMGNTCLAVENVYREYIKKGETIHALSNINMNIENGTFNILCGRSGSGKTTLLNILSTIDLPTSGRVFYNDIDITKLHEVERDNLRRTDMGLVFQSTALVSLMTAQENVEYALNIAGMPAKGRSKLATHWLDQVGIEDRKKHMPAQLSGGEQQRVGIARAIAHSPKLLFADEPTAELDTQTAFKIVDLFRTLTDREGLTIIMTTHDVNIMDIADNIYTLQDGEIVDERKNKN